jgi:hypothetical protein
MAIAPTQSRPTRIDCLQCQLTGHRKLTCSKADVCKELPHNYFLGPALLAAWVVTLIAFFFAVR